MTGPIRAQLKLRNNRLMRLREQLGLKPSEMAERIGMSYGHYLTYEAMSPSARLILGSGEWSRTALRIAEYHGLSPEYLWPEAVRQLKRTTAEREVSEEEAWALMAGADPEPILLPDELVNQVEEAALVTRELEGLKPREQLIVREKNDGKTYSEIGAVLGLSLERTRRLHVRALGVMRESLRHRVEAPGD